ncbi:MAG TPA: hypothetical protein VHA05_01910 [Candidatus Saccharimonadales bacterium]|nr:hypothetical protein [Candidatus Saccharimonadales bacterium]
MNTYRLYKAEFLATVVALVGTVMLSVSLVAAPVASAVTIGGPSDCDKNAIIYCGAHSTEELIHDYNNSAYVRGVYAEFGITQADISNLPSTNVVGRVTKDGNVFVDGKSQAVATNAVTGGQQNMPGSTRVNHQGAIFYKRTPSVSFQQDSLPAFVSMNNGRFQFAVIASCGNAVSATPTAQPQQPTAVAPAKPVSKPQQKPQPKSVPTPAPSMSQSQSQEVNVNNTNTNVNNNTNLQMQVNEQKVVAQTAKATPKPKPTPEQPAKQAQPASQNTAATLPNTGPTGVVGAFLIAVGIGTFAYHRLLVRRFASASR